MSHELDELALIISVEDHTNNDTVHQVVPLYAARQFCLVWRHNLYDDFQVGYAAVDQGGMATEFIPVGRGFKRVPKPDEEDITNITKFMES